MSYILDPSFYVHIHTPCHWCNQIKINSAFCCVGCFCFWFFFWGGRGSSNSRSRASSPEGKVPQEESCHPIPPTHPITCSLRFPNQNLLTLYFYLIYFEKSPPSFKSAPCTVNFFFFFFFLEFPGFFYVSFPGGPYGPARSFFFDLFKFFFCAKKENIADWAVDKAMYQYICMVCKCIVMLQVPPHYLFLFFFLG